MHIVRSTPTKRAASLSPVTALLLSLLLFATPLASAQVMTSSLPGISVTGQGRASAPAETATIAIMVSSGDYYMMEPPMEYGEEEAAIATPEVSAEESIAPVIDALVAAGVPEGDIDVIVDPSSAYSGSWGAPLMQTIRFTIDDPATDRIKELLDTAADAASDAGLFVNMTTALYGVADCDALERDARAAAIADARTRAGLQAELLDVELGDLVASRDDIYGAMIFGGMFTGMQVNGCLLDAEDASMTSIYNAPPFDPLSQPEVTVTHSVELTFAIGSGVSATPAP
jgi:uncharacterized protein YggE